MNLGLAALMTTITLAVGSRANRWLGGPRGVEARGHDDDALPTDQQPQTITISRRSRRAAFAVGTVVAVLIDPVLPIGFVVIAMSWPRVRSLLLERRRRGEIMRAVPDAIELLVLMIRAGLTPRHAVIGLVDQAPRPIRPGFVEVERRLHRGDGLADALRGLPEVLGAPLDPVADTLAIAERHGTPIGDALTQLSAEVRQQRRRAAEADARKLPVRLSFPLVFCTLPSFVLVAIAPAILAALSSLGDSTW